ncbi:hypothetical protein NKG05_25440 [Oerskovia sp. M15]
MAVDLADRRRVHPRKPAGVANTACRRLAERAQPDLGVLSSRLLFAVQEELFETLAAQGHPGLRPQHGAVLAYLDEEGSRATELARSSGQHKQVVGSSSTSLKPSAT